METFDFIQAVGSVFLNPIVSTLILFLVTITVIRGILNFVLCISRAAVARTYDTNDIDLDDTNDIDLDHTVDKYDDYRG